MPDIENLLKGTISNEDKSTQSKVPTHLQTEREKKLDKTADENLTTVETAPTDRVLNQQEQSARASNMVANNQAPITSELSPEPEAQEGVLSAEKTQKDFLGELGSNFVVGVGRDIIGGTGDILNLLGAATGINSHYEGNAFGNKLNEWGAILEEKGTAIPDALKDPKMSVQTFTDPQFWSTQIVSYIPQLVEYVFLSKGAGAAAKGRATAAGKAAARRSGGLLKKGTTTLFSGAKANAGMGKKTYELANSGKGITGKLLKDTGELTKLGGAITETVGAGIGGNIFSGLMNASEAYQSRAEMTDDQGNKLFTEEELGEIASSTFLNNMKWVGIDMLSWGMTYGKGAEIIKKIGAKPKMFKFGQRTAAGAKAGKEQAIKKTSSMFTKTAKPLVNGIFRAAKKAIPEGLEETFQETFEEWVVLRAEDKVMGREGKYAGVGGYLDFYASKESEGTRTIAAALGGLGGGVSGLVTSINDEADRQAQLYDASENLKTIFESGDEEGKTQKKFHLREMVSDAVLNGKEEQVGEYLEHSMNEEIIDEGDMEGYQELMEDYMALKEQATKLNIRGKYSLFKNHTDQKYLETYLEDLKVELQDKIEIINQIEGISDSDRKTKIKQEVKRFESESRGVISGIAEAQYNKANLILGKEANSKIDIEFIEENGRKIPVVGLNEDDFKTFVKDTDAEILSENKVSNFFDRIKKSMLGNPAKKIYDDLIKKNENKEESVKEQPEVTEDIEAEDVTDQEGDINEAEAEASVSPEETESTEDGEKPKVEKKAPKKNLKPLDESEDEELAELGEIMDSHNKRMEVADKTIAAAEKKLKDPDTDPKIVKAINEKLPGIKKRKKAIQAEIDKLKPKFDELSERAKNSNDDNFAEHPDLDPLATEEINEVDLENDENINPKVAENIASKLKDKSRLTPKQKEIYSKFKDAIDGIIENVGSQSRQFTNYIKSDKFGEQVKQAKKKAKAAAKKTTESGVSKEVEKRIKRSIKRFKSVNNPFDGNESREIDYQGPTLIGNEEIDDLAGISPESLVRPIGRIKYGPNNTDKMAAVNERLVQLFPNMKRAPQVVILDNLTSAIGIQGVGYAIGATFYIQSNKWDQGTTYMHEMSHIFYKFGKDEPQTKQILKEVMANKDLIKTIVRRYPDKVFYEHTDDFGNKTRGHLDPSYFKKTNAELAEEGIKVVPLSEQSIILEEAFVATLEGPLSKKYNKFFAPKAEYSRQKKVAGWWGSIKENSESDTSEQDNIELARKLAENEDLTVDNMRDFMVNSFKDAVDPIRDSEIGFEMRMDNFKAAEIEVKADISENLNDEQASFEKSVFEINKDSYIENTPLEELMDIEITEDHVSDDSSNPIINLMDKTFQAKASKATKILRNFIKDYNRAVRLRSLYGKKAPLFDRMEFMYTMFETAKYSPDNLSFINSIENSKDPDVIAFNEFLKIKAPGQRRVLLNGIKTVMGNFKMFNAMNSALIVDKDGNIDHQLNDSLSRQEQGRVQNMLAVMAKKKNHFLKKDGHISGKEWVKFENALDRIQKNEETPKDYVFAWRFISSGGNVKISNILDYGFLNYKGTYWPPETILKSFVAKNLHKGDFKGVKNGSQFVDPYKLKVLVESLAATNRAFTQDSLVQNAKNNSVPVRITNNNISKELEMLHKILRPDREGNRISKEDFLKKFSHITRGKRYKNTTGNLFLDNFYDSVVKNNAIPDMVYYTGIDDRVSNKGKTFDESTSYEQSYEDLMFYVHNKNKGTYLHNLGVLGDSPRKFFLPVKRIKHSEVFTGNTISDGNPILKSTYDIYRNIYNAKEGLMSPKAFKASLLKSIQKERDFIQSNSKQLSKIKQLKPYFDKRGKLNREGLKMVQEYVVNTMANGMYVAEVFAPNISSDEIEKRMKNSSSPVYSVNDKLRFEPIVYKDAYLESGNSTDGGQYILEEDAIRWRNVGLGIFDLNHGFKFLNYSVEKDNPKFKSQTLLFKGYTTVLSKAEVEKNPKLEGLYNLMQERRKKYNEWHQKKNNGAMPSMNFSDGTPNSFVIAIPQSSVKGNKQLEKNPDLPSLEELAKDRSKANTFQDKMMYSSKGSFVGLSGYNFGPQQVMDKQTFDVTLPVQQINSILVGAGMNGNIELAEEIQKLYSDEMEANLDKILRRIKKTDGVQGYHKFIMENLDEDSMDQVQLFAIEEYGINHSRAHQIIVNTLANQLKVNGNKLKVPGTYSHQKSDFGYEIPGGYNVHGSERLHDYQSRGDGGTNPAGIILPKHLSTKVRAREYFHPKSSMGQKALDIMDQNTPKGKHTMEADDLAVLKKMAKKRAKTLNSKTGEVTKDGKTVGYYVEGEKVIATRVPSNGPNFTGVFEVVDFNTGEGNQVQVPTSFTQIIGADLDGDALFIQHKDGKGGRIDKAIDKLIQLWTSPEMKKAITTKMETDEDGAALKKVIENKFPKKESDRIIPFSPESRRLGYENSMIAKRNIGTVFNLHRVSNILAAYEGSINNPVSVDGIVYRSFMDTSTGKDSRNYKSALIANLILDNLKNQTADVLNINEHTVSAFTLMVNLGMPIETAATLMNAPMVKSYVKLLNENNSAYHGYVKKSQQMKELKTISGYNEDSTTDITSDVNDPEFFSVNNQSAIIKLIEKMETLNGEVQNISRIMAGHNGIETNPHLLEKHIEKFKDTINGEITYSNKSKNKGNQMLQIPGTMSENPDIKRYLKTAEATLEHTKELDYVYRPMVTKLFKKLGQAINEDGLTNNQIRKYSHTVQQFLNSRLLGTNEQYSEEYIEDVISTDRNNPNSVFSQMAEYLSELSSEGKLEQNMLLSDGLNLILSGNRPVISMNKSFFDESVTKPEFKKMRLEFENLPLKLQNDLFLYDLVTHRWDSTYSLLPVMSKRINDQIMKSLNEDFKVQKTLEYEPSVVKELERVIVAKDFTGQRNNFQKINLSEKSIENNELIEVFQSNAFFRKRLADNEPFYFVANNKKRGKDGKLYFEQSLYYSPSLPGSVSSNELNETDRVYQNAKSARKHIQKVDVSGNLDAQLITITGKKKGPTPLRPLKPIEEGNEAREEYWRYDRTEPLNFDQFSDAMEFTEYHNQAHRERAFDNYEREKAKANKVYEDRIKGVDFSAMDSDGIMSLYKRYAEKQPYAWSIVTTPIIRALADNISSEQSKVTGKYQTSDDISALQAMFLSNNVPSNHPAVQGMVRHMEVEHKKFMGEKKKYAKQINDATDALYNEVFGFSMSKFTPWGLAKRLYYSLFFNRKTLYDRLYQPLVTRETVYADTKPVEEFKLKTKDEIEKLYKSGDLSEAHYNFYNTFNEITEKLAPYSSNKGKLRKNYIPHVNMSNLESFANRGILGLMVNSKPEDERIMDVQMFMKNPTTGEKEIWSFKEITDFYKSLAVSSGNNLHKVKEYMIMKRGAKKLLAKHQNEDGSRLTHNVQEIDSALEFGMMNRFTHGRSVTAQEMPSMDLNHALMTYVHATLFVNGNENFGGFKKMQATIDGIMSFNESKGLGNINKYVKVNWKDAYLKGQKQELFGKRVDDAIDLVTKLNLFWQLGGKVAYVVNNVVAGKYHNIKNSGGSSWAKGEKRFWGMDDINSPWDIPKRMKRAQRILKNINFLDINIYDNVSFQNSNRLDNLLGELSLAPMAWSEKWIQGVQMLGLMTDEQWSSFDDNGDLIPGRPGVTPEQVTEMENEVKSAQGKGYQMTDQRAIQQYSLGRMFMQFARFVPTMFHDRFAKQDVNIYGKEHIGSLRAVYDTVLKVQSMNPKDYVSYRKRLQKTNPELAKRLDSGLKGLAMSGIIGGFAILTNSDLANNAYWDANYYADLDKLAYKIKPSAVRTTQNLVDSIL